MSYIKIEDMKINHPDHEGCFLQNCVSIYDIAIAASLAETNSCIDYNFLIKIASECMLIDTLLHFYEKSDIYLASYSKYSQYSSKNKDIKKAMFIAACGNNVEFIRVLSGRHKLSSLCAEEAVKKNKLDCLKYLIELQCPWNSSVCSTAARCGNIDCLKYAHENGCPWNTLTFTAAVESGELSTLKYLIDERCPWDTSACNKAVELGDPDLLRFLHENLPRIPWDSSLYAIAASGGYKECILYAYENNCPPNFEDKDVCYNAIKSGDLSCLKFVCSNGFTLCDNPCTHAAKFGNLPALEYLHSIGAEWDGNACSHAAANGHLHCLEYLHRNKCPWGSSTCRLAIKSNQLDCFKYAVQNGCSWQEDICYDIASSNNNISAIKYIHKNSSKCLLSFAQYKNLCCEQCDDLTLIQDIICYIKFWLLA